MTTSDHDPRHGPTDDDLADDVLPDDELAALRALLGDVPAATPERRTAHLVAALAEFDSATSASPPATVVPLRRTGALRLMAAAAAIVILIGFGVSVALRSDTGDDAAESMAAGAPTAEPDRGTAPGTGDGANGSVTETSAFAQRESAAEAAPAVGDVVDLGTFADDDAVRLALRELAGTDLGASHQGLDEDLGSADPSTSRATAAPSSIAAAATAAGCNAPAAATGQIPSGAVEIASALVADRPVSILRVPDGRFVAVDLITCAVRAL